jgi:transcriptional regulator with XRE-family HTH domain
MAATPGTPRARALSAALREARKASGFGVRELARRLSLSHVQISHWESGHRVPKLEAVAMILAVIGASPDERERILDLARNVGEPIWLTVGGKGIPQQLAGVVECERTASAITEWSPLLMPGLLQTVDYLREILQSGGGLSQSDVELRVMLKASRSEVIARRADPVRYTALVGEWALREPIGPPAVMADQLNHLLAMTARP